MYRNKMMVIATLFVVGLLGVMIWSSNVVADNHAQQKKEAAEETDIMSGDFAKEHLNNDENKDGTDKAANGENAGDGDIRSGAYIDNNDLEPPMTKRYTDTRRVKSNYLDQFYGNNLVLWNRADFPLKVYVKNSEAIDKDLNDSIKSAFNNWQNSTNNFVTFNFVTAETGANIVVEIIDRPAGNCSEEGDFRKNIVIKNNRLQKTEILVSKTLCDGSGLTPSNLFSNMQHQIGHILGLNAHSKNSIDVMYPKQTYENVNISTNDLNTFLLLYKFIPDVTSSPYKPSEISKLMRFSSIKGKTGSELNEYLEENLPGNNTKADPIELAINDGMQAFNQGKYIEAANIFNKALSKAEKNSDKAYLYRCISICYLKSGSRNMDAYSYAMQAQNMEQSPLNKYLVAYVQFVTGNEAETIKLLRDLIKEYPKLRCSYALLGQIYRKNYRMSEFRELAKQAKAEFYENPPVTYTEPEAKTKPANDANTSAAPAENTGNGEAVQ